LFINYFGVHVTIQGASTETNPVEAFGFEHVEGELPPLPPEGKRHGMGKQPSLLNEAERGNYHRLAAACQPNLRAAPRA
jgi:hypothetical protein